jgi:hypothetical protein
MVERPGLNLESLSLDCTEKEAEGRKRTRRSY